MKSFEMPTERLMEYDINKKNINRISSLNTEIYEYKKTRLFLIELLKNSINVKKKSLIKNNNK